jgi:hypothetical protein
MLGGPDEILPQHAVVPVAGTLEKVQQAFKRAQDAVDRGEPYQNPLDDGEIILPQGGGPFWFVPGPQIMGQPASGGKGKEIVAQEAVQVENFPRADLTFDLSDLLPLPDLNEDIMRQPPQEIVHIADEPQEQDPNEDIMRPPPQEIIHIADEPQEQLGASLIAQAIEDGPDGTEPPVKKTAMTVTYERRRSERLKHKLDGVRQDSVDRASQRKASSAGDSDSSSMGSTSTTRRRKTRRLPDINKVAPLPITSCPPETDRNKLEMLANCCGYMTLDAVEKALKQMEKNKEGPGTSKLDE